jgi:pre-mRNA-splicing helicase BRR2
MEIDMNLDIDDEAQNKNDNIQATTYLEIEEKEKSDDEDNIIQTNNKNIINDDDSDLNLDLIINDISYLRKYLGKVLNIKDEKILNEKENNLYGYLNMENQNECENNLFMMVGHENTKLIEFLLINRNIILFLYLIQKANTPEKKTELINNLKKNSKESYDILNKKHYFEEDKDIKTISTRTKTKSEISEKTQNSSSIILSNIDLSKYDYIEEDHYIRSQSLKLATNIIEKTGQGYKEITIPPPKKNTNSKRIKQFPVTSLPSWMYNAFQIKESINDEKGPIQTNIKFITEKFNEIQSKVLPTVLNTDENLLICAPTSSGKTNIALLSIMRLLSLYRDEKTEIIDTKSFKVVYIAPMKALIKEIVGYFSQRLEYYGVVVKELSGDVNLSNYEINNTNIIVTTPEKYDIITRKTGQRTFIEKVKLIIIDEIHLLHDIRGSVLESIISRIMLSKISKNKYDHANNLEIRLIGLSATLPNFQDVANFLQVNSKKGLFYFDSTYRPIPLKQTFLGISEKKGVKKMLLTNELTYMKTVEKVAENKQVIIFVHSRRETVKTAEYLINSAKGHGELQKFKTNIPSQANEVFEEDIKMGNIVDKNTLLYLYQNGVGVHHAGMTVKDKKTVEDYFNNKFINVIVSTATLAWGVNLPAHCVIIKGTQVYRPELGRWGELSFLDILQMMGRAGRVGYIDEKTNYGEGIIITTEEELLFYLSIMNQNLTVESQLIRSLPDALNAEIVNGNITMLLKVLFGLNILFYIKE